MGSLTRKVAVAAAAAVALMGLAPAAHAFVVDDGRVGGIGDRTLASDKLDSSFNVDLPVEMAPEPAYSGPTADIAAVANAITYEGKSVTTVVRVPAGIAIAQNVNISVGYVGNFGGDRITQDYVPSTGNRFLYNFAAGDATPYTASVVITLSQANGSGGLYTLSIPWSPTITPLYDVSFGPLTFKLLSDCDWVGRSEIRFHRYDPEGTYHRAAFSLREGESWTDPTFAGSWSEVSTTSPLFELDMGFWELDPALPGSRFIPGTIAPQTKLVPGTTKLVDYVESEIDYQCAAEITYDQTYTLDWYPYL